VLPLARANSVIPKKHIIIKKKREKRGNRAGGGPSCSQNGWRECGDIVIIREGSDMDNVGLW